MSRPGLPTFRCTRQPPGKNPEGQMTPDQTPMKPGRHDIVLLPDGTEGKVLERFTTDRITVYKIQKGLEIQYFDEHKVKLKKRHFLNRVKAIFSR
jgi:hypothetical protein